jgi:chorismate mutase
MALSGFMRRCAVALGAVALAVTPTTPPARGDDVNPLLELVDAATQRLQTAEPVAATKWLTGGSIEDPQRVDQVLAAVSADATGRGVDGNYVRQMFTDQIHATEAIEYTRFAQWKLDPASAPDVAPDLAASRASIDRLNAEMVEQVAVHSSVLRSPDCTGALDDAKAAVTTARTLDSLYRQALSFSTRSYCR